MPEQEGIFRITIDFLALMFGFQDVRVTDVKADYDRQVLEFRLIQTGSNPRWFGGELTLFTNPEGTPLEWVASVTTGTPLTVLENFKRVAAATQSPDSPS